MYGRAPSNEPTTFGTTGYTMRNTFVLYDRSTETVWYPRESYLEATSGPRRGEKIPFIEKPEPMRLAEWGARHPETLVLIGDGDS